MKIKIGSETNGSRAKHTLFFLDPKINLASFSRLGESFGSSVAVELPAFGFWAPFYPLPASDTHEIKRSLFPYYVRTYV